MTDEDAKGWGIFGAIFWAIIGAGFLLLVGWWAQENGYRPN